LEEWQTSKITDEVVFCNTKKNITLEGSLLSPSVKITPKLVKKLSVVSEKMSDVFMEFEHLTAKF
jgi:hypothetical protein